MKIALLLICSYILGGVPFGLIIGKLARGIDIRTVGSGNIGATNVYRALGPVPATVVFLLDVIKGFIPTAAAKLLFPELAWLTVASGLVAVLGHTFSMFLNFRGGKGVATTLGVLIAFNYYVAAISFGVWLITVTATRIVSIASILAAASVPIGIFVYNLSVYHKAFGILVAIFVIIKHRSNMTRLVQGKEPRWGQKIDPGTGRPIDAEG